MSDTANQGIHLPQLARTLRRTAKEIRRTTARTAWYRLVWQWLAVVAALFALDLIFGLPVWLRWLGLIGQGVFLLVSGASALQGRARLRVGEEWAARVVEQRHPEVDNALINAVQFERAVTQVDPARAGLMRREMDRAERMASSVPVDDSVDRAAERAALIRMAALLASWAVTATLFSGVFMAVMPRLFLPWMDDVTPPYSPTKFNVRPPGATVRYGDSLTIAVGVSGRQPENMALMTQSQGQDWHRIALDSEGADSYSIKLDALHDDTTFYVQGSTGRSARYRIVVTRPPVVSLLHATYTYPTYTAKPPSTQIVGAQGLHGLAGTGVALQIGSNRELRAGELTIQTSEGATQHIVVDLDPKSTFRASVHLALSRPGEFHLALTAVDGQVNSDAAHGKIVIDKDQRPNVWIAFPAQDLLVTPDMKVPIQVQAEDDIAVQHVEIHRIINDLSDSPRDFPSAPPAPKMGQRLAMDLSELGLRPGDRITYYASAYDNAPGTPNVGESEVYTLKVVTSEEFAQALKEQRQASDLGQETRDIVGSLRDMAQQQEQLARQMEQLSRQLAKNPGDRSLQQQMSQARQAQQALQKQAQQFAQSLQDYSKSPSSTDLERALKQKLAQIAQQLSTAAQGAMQQAQSGSPGQSAAAARAASRQLSRLSGQATRQIQTAIEHLAEILPLYNDIDRFMALLDQQGQLVLKARQFQQTLGATPTEKSRLDQLANEQSRIAHELTQLQQDLIQHAAACEEHFPKAAASARRIAAEIGTRQITSLMETGRDRFRQWDGPQGFANARSALEQMQAMVKTCQGSQGQACSELDIALTRSLGQQGLGSSLGQFSQGMGSGGAGLGIGGSMAGPTGQPGGGFAMRGAKAFVPSAPSMSGTGGDRRMQHANRTAGQPAGLAPKEVEVVRSASGSHTAAGDHEGSGYPAEYRKLVSDYFRSVAEHP